MNRLTIIIIFIANISFGQVRINFLSDFLLEDELNSENVNNEYYKFDFSNIWVKAENNVVFGIIGEEHQRLRIKLISIEKNPFDSTEYIVYGKSMVKENICDFIGIIRIMEIKKVAELHYGIDEEYKDKGIQSQGILIAKYEFRESKDQNHSGIFKGKLYSKWYLDSNHQIRYDEIQSIADGYTNNAFIGIWESYKTGKEKLCNWGDYRVPQANQDFDIGAGKFSVSEKYWNKGWLDIALNNQVPNRAIIRKESKDEIKKWWE
jgi:hypothetical protein